MSQVKYYRHQQGMTLLEVVVSMLLIGLGMVASISMIQEGMRSNVSAHNRNSALYLSDAIIDRMRVNSFALPQYLAGSAGSLVSGVDSSGKAEAPAAKSCDDCKEDQQKNAYGQARTDIQEWRAELSQKLPGATYAIYAEDADKGQYAIVLSWPNRIFNASTADSDGVSASAPTDSIVTVFTL